MKKHFETVKRVLFWNITIWTALASFVGALILTGAVIDWSIKINYGWAPLAYVLTVTFWFVYLFKNLITKMSSALNVKELIIVSFPWVTFFLVVGFRVNFEWSWVWTIIATVFFLTVFLMAALLPKRIKVKGR